MKFLSIIILGFLQMSGAEAESDELGSDGKDGKDGKEVPAAETLILHDLDIIELMTKKGWNADNLLQRKIGNMVAFERARKYVGYCVIEKEQIQVPSEDIELAGITKILFGDPTVPSSEPRFVITDPNELGLWVAACRNHSKFPRYAIRFVSLSQNSGFENARIDVPYSEAHGCHEGLHFYRGSDRVHLFHFHYQGEHSPGTPTSSSSSPNAVLESMIMNRLSEKSQ